MARKQNHLKRLSDKYAAANKLKRKREMSSAGIKFDAPANVQHKKVGGEIVIKQSMRGKQKQYRTSKPLI